MLLDALTLQKLAVKGDVLSVLTEIVKPLPESNWKGFYFKPRREARERIFRSARSRYEVLRPYLVNFLLDRVVLDEVRMNGPFRRTRRSTRQAIENQFDLEKYRTMLFRLFEPFFTKHFPDVEELQYGRHSKISPDKVLEKTRAFAESYLDKINVPDGPFRRAISPLFVSAIYDPSFGTGIINAEQLRSELSQAVYSEMVIVIKELRKELKRTIRTVPVTPDISSITERNPMALEMIYELPLPRPSRRVRPDEEEKGQDGNPEVGARMPQPGQIGFSFSSRQREVLEKGLWRQWVRSPSNTRWRDLLRVATMIYGEPRIAGGHFVFPSPLPGHPILLSPSPGNAPAVFVKKFISQVRKLEEAYGI